MQQKIYRSFKQLQGLKANELFTDQGNLKRIPAKTSISIARQLADGFDFSLKEQPTKSQELRARRVIREFFALRERENYTLVRPSKKNRKLYAQFSDVPRTFKIYPMPTINSDDKFKIREKGGRKYIIRTGEFYVAEFYPFPNRKKLATNPVKATSSIWAKIKAEHKNKFTVRIKCGRGEFAAQYEAHKEVGETIADWIAQYGKERVKAFCAGVVVYTFKNGGDEKPIKKPKLKKRKPKLPKRRLL